MTGTMRDLDVLAYQLRLTNVLADDGNAYDRVSKALTDAAIRLATVERMTDEIPLRRLVWHVIEPGESFSVGEVMTRLHGIGAMYPNTQVSNALGYLVKQGRLVRLRQGKYEWSIEDSLKNIESRPVAS